MRRRPATLVLFLLFSLARAATAAEPPTSFFFAFSNPGARSLAFGGAFAPLADDATAGYANPAGLVQLLRPELSLEARLDGDIGRNAAGETSLSRADGVSFFSAAYPLRRVSFAVYAHKLARTALGKLDLDLGSGRSPLSSPKSGVGERLAGLDVWRIALAAGYRLRENVSLGAGVSYFSGSVSMAPVGGGPKRSVEDSDWALNAGVLWSPAEKLRLAGFFRQGPSLSLGTVAGCGAGATASLRLPDTYGAGAALRSFGGALTTAFEWDHVRYSSLESGLSAASCGSGSLSVPDADELHAGVEYAFLRLDPLLALRLGAWLDPDHRLCGTGDSPYPCAPDSGGSELHGTLGLGVALRHVQLDFAVDTSNSRVTVSFSGIVGF